MVFLLETTYIYNKQQKEISSTTEGLSYLPGLLKIIFSNT